MSKLTALDARFEFAGMRRRSLAQTKNTAKTATVAGGCKWLKIIGGAEEGRTPGLRIAN
jgi:hypothetical protein